MTSEEKLAKILAMRYLRGILQQHVGTIDFHGMCLLLGSQPSEELSNGEAEQLITLRGIMNRTDDRKLEGDMKSLDSFKLELKKQVDSLIAHLRVELAG